MTLSLHQPLTTVCPPADPTRVLAPPADDLGMALDSEIQQGVSRRVASIDILRGICIAMMVFVDEVGHAYPHINHSPWNGITLADFVMVRTKKNQLP